MFLLKAKQNLLPITHYQQTLAAELLFGNFMAIDTKAAIKLVNQYFPENL